MKMGKTIFLGVMLAMLFSLVTISFSSCSQSEAPGVTSTPIGDVSALSTHAIGEPKFDISSIIRDLATEERVAERYQMYRTEKPKTYRYDPSVYLLEYGVSTEYWNKVSKMSYEGMTQITEEIGCSYPIIYIPMFGDVPDSNGNLQSRFIGYIKLHYNPLANDYLLQLKLYSIASDDFKNKRNIWFYDEIANYLLQSKTTPQQVFLIRYPGALSDSQERIAVIKSKSDTVILDVSNSLQIDFSKNPSAIAYTVEEYRMRRLEVEKDLYQAGNTEGNLQTGEKGNSSSNEPQDDAVEVVPYF